MVCRFCRLAAGGAWLASFETWFFKANAFEERPRNISMLLKRLPSIDERKKLLLSSSTLDDKATAAKNPNTKATIIGSRIDSVMSEDAEGLILRDPSYSIE